MHQRVQARQTPDGDHTDSDSDQGDDHAADDIDEVHLAIVRDRQREVGVEKQPGRQRARGGGKHRGKQTIPQRRLVAAVQGLRKNQRGGHRGAEEGADGA